jgi:hypothetical protein
VHLSFVLLDVIIYEEEKEGQEIDWTSRRALDDSRAECGANASHPRDCCWHDGCIRLRVLFVSEIR